MNVDRLAQRLRLRFHLIEEPLASRDEWLWRNCGEPSRAGWLRVAEDVLGILRTNENRKELQDVPSRL